MKNQLITIVAFLMIAAVLVGCKKTPTLLVDRTDAGELEVVSQLAAKQEDYRHWLAVLESYYKQADNLDMLRWARRESENLKETGDTFIWSWQPEVTPPPAESLVGRDEGVLIEYTVSARIEYLHASDNLQAFYASKSGSGENLSLVDQMRENFCPVKTYLYSFNAEIPGEHLRPSEVSPEATRLYEDAVRLHNKGGNVLTLPKAKRHLQEQALQNLLTVVRQYPKSTKIALSAYLIADIYKEYFDEDIRAVRWYERAWQWDSEIAKPARFQAAVVYDYRLKNYAQALKLYRASRIHDPFRYGNDNWARKRIKQLTEPK